MTKQTTERLDALVSRLTDSPTTCWRGKERARVVTLTETECDIIATLLKGMGMAGDLRKETKK